MLIDSLRKQLKAAQNPDGSWGYLSGQKGRPEPTLLAAAAGLEPPIDWLAQKSLGWSRFMLPACLLAYPQASKLRERYRRDILQSEGQPVPNQPQMGHDTELVGWAWVANTHSWVEPTAMAIISLKRLGHGSHPRVLEGLKLLKNRQCADGGWNVGNPKVFDAELPSYVHSTAWALMALGPEHPSPKAWALIESLKPYPSLLNLSLTLLAQVVHGVPTHDTYDALLAWHKAKGGFGDRLDELSWALIAMQGHTLGTHPFDVRKVSHAP